jgi:Cytidylate kinase-like family
MAARVVCISRTLGAGGADVGRAVSEQLGFRYVDEEIVAHAAERAQVGQEVLADAERRRTLARRLLDELVWAGTSQLVPATSPTAYATGPYREVIADVVRETAEGGNVVIVAHAASHALARQPGLLRVLVTAPDEIRARRLAAEEGVGEQRGMKLVRESDADRAAYLKTFYGVSVELPVQYDLVVNTDALTPGEASALIVTAAGFGLDARRD